MTKTKDNYGRKRTNVTVGEDLKIASALALQKFCMTEDQKELEFPSSLTSAERAYIHQLAQGRGLNSKSRGKGATRFLTVYKKEGSTIVQADAVFQLARGSRNNMITLLQRFPVTNKERQDFLPLTERDRILLDEGREVNKAPGRLNNGVPQVPPVVGPPDNNQFRETLPIWDLKDEIVKVVDQHQVVLIVGDTGSGKTTQTPQFIMDNCHRRSRPCRIICTQPRRISVLTVAERVACERNDKIGQTVGYQIRLESRVSPKTILTFCTSGVLLRTLMGGDSTLATVTHIIVDEIHERDKFSDYLLIVLRDALAKFRNLKLILMSAALDVQLFVKYFNGCCVVRVPGKMYEVKELYLEDVLKLTGYMSRAMQSYKNTKGKLQTQQKKLSDWCAAQENPSRGGALPVEDTDAQEGAASCSRSDSQQQVVEKSEMDTWIVKEMDRCISEAFLQGNEDALTHLLHLIMQEGVSVDYQHSETSVTSLMVAAGRGCSTAVEQLLDLGAGINVRASNDWTALDWAKNFERKEIVEIFESHIASLEISYSDIPDLVRKTEELQLTAADKELLDIYHHSFDDDKVDVDLILTLIHTILAGQEDGAILVFLPGYEDIVSIRDKILYEDKRFTDSSRFHLFTMHSNMQTFDQKKVFKPSPAGVKKIILSTNIAETSVTINDVVFVIDSGKVKEKSFDAIMGASTLKSVWISKASCAQRKGRAGRCRPGVCYRLFSRVRYVNMQEYQQPEILRVPLQELCLHTKLLAPSNTPIADFLARAPDPPAFMVTRNAVQLLKTIGALDPWEDLTELGHHLLDLPVDPRLGKMVLYAVVLKCLDPILTIVCTLAYKDPFMLPNNPADKQLAANARKKLADGTYSDHVTLLRSFQMWQQACADGWEKAYCAKNFLSLSSMEIIVGMRTQLLGQLRASGFVRARGCGDIRDLNANSENWAVVKAAICAGTYPNLIRIDRERMQLITQKVSKVRFHPSSVLAEVPKSARMSVSSAHTKVVESLPSDWLVYEEMTHTGNMSLSRCCTLVTPITVALFAGPMRLPLDAISETDGGSREGNGDSESDSECEEKHENQKTMLKLNDWIAFRIDSEAAHLAYQIRQKWHSLFMRRIRSPSKPWAQMDEAILQTVISVISAEECALGLRQPIGIGQRPRPMSTDSTSSTAFNFRHNYSESDSPSEDWALVGKKTSASLPLRKDAVVFRPRDERSDSSSVRSTSSIGGSHPMSPCHSPTGSSSDKDAHAKKTRYFVIKGSSLRAIETSVLKGTWTFTPSTERKLQKILANGTTVYVIFSVQGSGHFQGYARMTAEVTSEKVDYGVSGSGNAYKIEWIKRANLPFQCTRHLQNPWNEDRKVQISRDGQEMEPSVGEALCKLWDKMPNVAAAAAAGSSHGKVSDEGNLDRGRNRRGDEGDYRESGHQNYRQQFMGRPIRGFQPHSHSNSANYDRQYNHMFAAPNSCNKNN